MAPVAWWRRIAIQLKWGALGVPVDAYVALGGCWRATSRTRSEYHLSWMNRGKNKMPRALEHTNRRVGPRVGATECTTVPVTSLSKTATAGGRPIGHTAAGGKSPPAHRDRLPVDTECSCIGIKGLRW